MNNIKKNAREKYVNCHESNYARAFIKCYHPI